jgi:hypothetical protein
MLCQVRRWLPQRTIVVADSSFAVELLEAATQMPLPILVTRLRLDAALYHPAPPPNQSKWDNPVKWANAYLHSKRFSMMQQLFGRR